MIEYRIAQGRSTYGRNNISAISELENEVAKYIKDGFKPLGSPIHLREGHIIQAVYRDIPSSTEEEK